MKKRIKKKNNINFLFHLSLEHTRISKQTNQQAYARVRTYVRMLDLIYVLSNIVLGSINAHTYTPLANLVECRENVVCKLDFCDGSGAIGCQANTKAHDALLRQRRVEHTMASYEDRYERVRVSFSPAQDWNRKLKM